MIKDNSLKGLAAASSFLSTCAALSLLAAALATTEAPGFLPLALLLSVTFGSGALLWKALLLKRAIHNLHDLRYPGAPWAISWLPLALLAAILPSLFAYQYGVRQGLFVEPFTDQTRAAIGISVLILVYLSVVVLVPVVLARVYYQSLAASERLPPKWFLGGMAAFTTVALGLAGFLLKDQAWIPATYGVPHYARWFAALGYISAACSFLWQRRYIQDVTAAQKAAFSRPTSKQFVEPFLPVARVRLAALSALALILLLLAVAGPLIRDFGILKRWLQF